MTEEEKIICKQFLNDADKTHSCNEYKLLMALLDQEPTTKNDLGVDCISRAQARTKIEMNASRYTIAKERGGMGQVEWSDQLIKVSDAVDIIRNLPSVTPQEPQSFEWCETCKEYDQEKHCCHRYSKVIRDTVAEIEQEPILDKIRAELHATAEMHEDGDYYLRDEWIDEYFDKYKAESEEE